MRFKLHVDVYKIGAVFGSKHMCMYTILYLPQIVTVQCYYIAIALHVGENLDDHATDMQCSVDVLCTSKTSIFLWGVFV